MQALVQYRFARIITLFRWLGRHSGASNNLARDNLSFAPPREPKAVQSGQITYALPGSFPAVLRNLRRVSAMNALAAGLWRLPFNATR
jgi:hypothetical protein